MARSNKELAAEAQALAAELGETVETDLLKNADLVALVATLSERVRARREGIEPPAPTPPGPQGNDGGTGNGPPEPPRPPPSPPAARRLHVTDYVVAPRRSITSPRGVLGPGTEVREDDVGKREDLARLVELGAVVLKPRR